jgi:hypothetical protein
MEQRSLFKFLAAKKLGWRTRQGSNLRPSVLKTAGAEMLLTLPVCRLVMQAVK